MIKTQRVRRKADGTPITTDAEYAFFEDKEAGLASPRNSVVALQATAAAPYPVLGLPSAPNISFGATVVNRGTGTGITYTPSEFASTVITRSPSAASTDTTPTAAAIIGLFTARGIPASKAVGLAYEVTIVNTSANTITLAAGSGVTIVGSAAIGGGTSATFLVHISSPTTVTVYRT
jgi:hypothetical protein